MENLLSQRGGSRRRSGRLGFTRLARGIAILLSSAALIFAAGRVEADPPDHGSASRVESAKAKVGANEPVARPKWDDIEAAVRRHFGASTGFRPGEIISRGQVDALIVELKQSGWKVPQAPRLSASTLSDSNPLVILLRTEQGRRFMARLGGNPMSFDRLDRLCNLSDGPRIVRDLITNPGGQRLVDYLTSSQGGRNLAVQLSAVPSGVNFEKPTGKLYTVDALIAHLRVLYAAETAGQSKAR